MPTTYFRRYRMELRPQTIDLRPTLERSDGIRYLNWSAGLIKDHAMVLFESFRREIDAVVFPCLSRKDGCIKLMRDLARRTDFAPEATWLAIASSTTKNPVAVGSIQGLRSDSQSGAIKNLGIIPDFRGRGIGSDLLRLSAQGFHDSGCSSVHLEVTGHNTAAYRLYERFGFRQMRTVFKVSDVISE